MMSFSSKYGQVTMKTVPPYKLIAILKANTNHQYRVMIGICLISFLNNARKLNLTEHIAPHRGTQAAADNLRYRTDFDINAAISARASGGIAETSGIPPLLTEAAIPSISYMRSSIV